MTHALSSRTADFQPPTGLSRRSLLRGSLALAALPAFSSLLTACGGGETASKTAALSFWSRDSSANGAMIKPTRDRIASFDKLNGTNTNVQFLSFADSTQKELAALTGGGLPTMAEQGPDVAFQFASGGHLAALDDVYAQLKPNLLSLPDTAVTQENGHVYGLPWYLETRVLYYHKDLLDAAGVKPPTTWDEWLTAGKALTKGTEQYGFALAGQSIWPGQFFMPLAASAGATLLDGDGNLTTSTAELAETLDFLQKLYSQAMPAATPTYDATTSGQLFLTKKAAMIWDNGQVLHAIKTTKPELLDTVGAVLTPAADTSSISRSFLGGYQLFLFTKGQNLDRGKALLEYMYSDPAWYGNMLEQANGIGLPVLSAAASSSAFSTGIIKTMVDQQKTAVRYGGPAFSGNKAFLGKAETSSVFADPVIQVWSGKSKPAEAATSMLTALNSLATT